VREPNASEEQGHREGRGVEIEEQKVGVRETHEREEEGKRG
jgi:hypothetical protein